MSQKIICLFHNQALYSNQFYKILNNNYHMVNIKFNSTVQHVAHLCV